MPLPGVPFASHGDQRTIQAGRLGGQVTAVMRRAAREPWSGTILDIMDAADMVGETWMPWRAFWKAVYAIPMTPEERALFQRHTQGTTPPAAQVAEAWMCIGRGGGKTRNSALHAVYRVITFDAAIVDPGEDVVIPLLASDRRQARQALKYMRGFNALPLVSPYVFRGTLKERIEYKTGCDVEVLTATRKAPRGYSCPTGNCDEIAWWETLPTSRTSSSSRSRRISASSIRVNARRSEKRSTCGTDVGIQESIGRRRRKSRRSSKTSSRSCSDDVSEWHLRAERENEDTKCRSRWAVVSIAHP
jgi:hypothetical protein